MGETADPAAPGEEIDSVAIRKQAVFSSLCFDIALFIPEVLAVILSGSVTLFADVLKCGNEILATFFALVIILRMARGWDFTYDYGMGKFETITGIITGAVMFVSLVIIIVSAFSRLIVPEHIELSGVMIGIPLMVVTAIIDGYLWRRNYRLSLSDASPIISSQWHLRRAKTFADVTVLLALVLSISLRQFSWGIYIDPAASFIIAGFLLYAGIREISTSLPDLLDKTLDEELQIVILKDLTAFFSDYQNFYGVRSRRAGSNIYIEIFLGFDEDRRMGDIQGVIDRMKTSLERKIPRSTVCIVPTSGKCGKPGAAADQDL